MKRILNLLLIILPIVFSCNRSEVPDSHSHGRSIDDFLYIENDQIRLGIDTSMGGAITYLEIKEYGENMVNDFDLGRQIQISFFGGPNPFVPAPDKKPHPRWEFIGWNPIQAGDVFGYGSRIKDLYVGEDSIFVSCIPMHWPLENVPGQCVYESRIKLEGNKVLASARILNHREDKTKYPVRNSELPAVYSNGTYYRLFTYTGDEPFTNDSLTLVPKRHVKPGKFPWSRFQATEGWAALVNEDDIGMAVYSPHTERFLGGFTGEEGTGSTFDIPCGYICPVGDIVLDHNIDFSYEYVIVTGMLEDIRKDIYDLKGEYRMNLPVFDFDGGRQGWYYKNAADSGWPVDGMLNIHPLGDECTLWGPEHSYQSGEIKEIEIVAAFESDAAKFRFLWNRIEGSEKTEQNALEIDRFPGDGFHTYRFDPGEHPGFTGLITGIRLNFTDVKPTDRIKIAYIEFR